MAKLGSLAAGVRDGLRWAGTEMRTLGTSWKACAMVYRQEEMRLVQLCGKKVHVAEKGRRKQCRLRNLKIFSM